MAQYKRKIQNDGGSEKIEVGFFSSSYKISVERLWQSRARMAVPQSCQGPRLLPAHHSITSRLAPSSSRTIIMVASASAFTSAFQTVVWERGKEEGSLLYFKESS